MVTEHISQIVALDKNHSLIMLELNFDSNGDCREVTTYMNKDSLNVLTMKRFFWEGTRDSNSYLWIDINRNLKEINIEDSYVPFTNKKLQKK
jgi:hypothetical protein